MNHYENGTNPEMYARTSPVIIPAPSGQGQINEFIVQVIGEPIFTVLTNKGRMFQWVASGRYLSDQTSIQEWRECVYPPFNYLSVNSSENS